MSELKSNEQHVENKTDFGSTIDSKLSWVILSQGRDCTPIADALQKLGEKTRGRFVAGRALGKLRPVIGLSLLNRDAWSFDEVLSVLREHVKAVHIAYFDEGDDVAYILLPDESQERESTIDIARLVTAQRKSANPNVKSLFIPLGATNVRQVGGE